MDSQKTKTSRQLYIASAIYYKKDNSGSTIVDTCVIHKIAENTAEATGACLAEAETKFPIKIWTRVGNVSVSVVPPEVVIKAFKNIPKSKKEELRKK